MINTGHDDLDELYSELELSHPKLAQEAFEYWGKNMYHQAKCYLLEIKCGKHLNDCNIDEALDALSQVLETPLPLWSIDDLLSLLKSMGYSFDGHKISGKEYTIEDVDFLAQRERVIHKSLGSDPKKFIILAIESLDVDDEYAYDTYHRILENYDIK